MHITRTKSKYSQVKVISIKIKEVAVMVNADIVFLSRVCRPDYTGHRLHTNERLKMNAL